MRLVICSRENLSEPLETLNFPVYHSTIAQLLADKCPAFKLEYNRYISAYADGEKVTLDRWESFRLDGISELMFVLEPGASLSAAAIAAIISAVVAVASVAFSLIMMNRLDSPTTGNTKNGSTIYDVNAQGNKVKLQSVIPENFGYFKKFPDYLCDVHSFYRNNKYFLDLVLCQGRGYYQRAQDYSDIYIANTPLSELNDGSCQVRVYDPGTVITAQNSIEDKCWYGWYSSLEVTRQGKTLEGMVEEASSESGNVRYDTTLGSNYLTCYKTTYQYTANAGCAGVSTGYIPIRKEYPLPWEEGAYFHITGASAVRAIGVEDTSYTTLVGADTVTLYLAKTANLTDLTWLRARVTEIDPDTQEEVIVSAGDTIRVTYQRVSTVRYYSRPVGTSGPQDLTAEAVNEEEWDAEVLAVSLADSLLTITVSASEATIPAYPAYPSVDATRIISQTQTDRINAYEPLPADYPYDGDDGLYQIVSKEDAKTYVVRCTSSYGEDTSWTGFWSQGFSSSGVSFELDEESSDSAGEWVGPYRACPVGAVSDKYEIDIQFPSGLGTLNNSGGISSRTVTIEIQYRNADSNDSWTSLEQSWTNNTNDELAYTIAFDTETAGNYEFRIKNLSEQDESVQALQTVKWVGLKSCITTKNQYDNMTVIICRFRGSETLSELSQNQIWTLWTRKLPPITCADEHLDDPEYMAATRDIAPVVKYICDNSKYKGIVDNISLAEFDAWWKAKGMKLDGTLDDDNTLLEALRDVLKAGFSGLTVYENKLSFTRLHKQGVSEPLAQIFTPQNLTASPKATITLKRDDSVNEVVVEYIDPATYKTATRYVHLDENGEGVTTLYPTSSNQETLNAFGVTQEDVAIAMGLRRLRYLTYTTTRYEIKTELDGLNCQYNDLVGLVLDHNISNITGRVIAYADSVITVDRQIPQTLTAGIVYIRKLDGTMWQTEFSRVDSRNLTLAAELPFAWNDEYGSVLEYPFFAIGELVKCWVTNVKPNNKSCTLELVNYDERVFDDDPEDIS
ncbi:host specificity factor TipJ family phage tail protein [Succinimonas sp.]|uniref:host specificity factor TipJ family phage tail protein n=1 Tax=Succinimonas sp. TaxID=1936151 RepID=UPI0038642B31